MFTIEFLFRIGRDKGVDNAPPEIYDLNSGQIERSERTVMGFSPNEGWEDKR